jgi:23S rRNA pseudouridine1911/1915/1917 synthase
MTKNQTHQLHVLKKSKGLRLDKFIAGNMPEISRSMVQKLIEGNNVLKGNKVISDCSAAVREGDVYTLNIPEPAKSDMLPANIPLKIIYEDAEFLVIDKPAGLTVHPGAGNHDDTMANALLAHCGKSLSGIGGVMRPGIVHRLDKDTSGLIMAAKTDRAHNNLSAQIASRALKRTYLAICWGVPKQSQGRIEANIGRSTKNRKKMAVVESGGKTASTNYSVIEIFGADVASLVECRLDTGRTHQIRVHMLHLGHPLVGDQAYSGRRAGAIKTLSNKVKLYLADFKRQALHSHKIRLNHPVNNEEMEFISALPEDIAKLAVLLRQNDKAELSV